MLCNAENRDYIWGSRSVLPTKGSPGKAPLEQESNQQDNLIMDKIFIFCTVCVFIIFSFASRILWCIAEPTVVTILMGVSRVVKAFVIFLKFCLIFLDFVLIFVLDFFFTSCILWCIAELVTVRVGVSRAPKLSSIKGRLTCRCYTHLCNETRRKYTLPSLLRLHTESSSRNTPFTQSRTAEILPPWEILPKYTLDPKAPLSKKKSRPKYYPFGASIA